MTFKEFVDWCNNRACDGCWSLGTVVACIDIIREVRRKPFWKREKYWSEHYKEDVVEQIVNPINKRIEELERSYGTSKQM